MDQNDGLKLAPTYLGKYHFVILGRTLQLVISVALLSVFLCYSSGFSFFPHSFSVYFSTVLFSFFTRTLERKYMFLICNGILAFLAKSSISSTSSTSASDLDAMSSRIATSNSRLERPVAYVSDVPVRMQRISPSDDADTPILTEEEHADRETEEQESHDELLHREEEEESKVPIVEDDGSEEAQTLGRQEKQEIDAVETPEAANYEDIASTEELNRKIEEFIRKMKEEIRIEAQQQLIAV